MTIERKMGKASQRHMIEESVEPNSGQKKLKCAIYTRKSTSNGLEQEFNTLQAQRETCEAYILSQKHTGWICLETQYNDGGYSGGTTERPAFKRLMQDMRNGIVDIIVVYKVDRLTRSIRDFAKIVDELDHHKASFVSVTQQFNTTNAMGRLTLNVLLSFAQFEREVSSERVRDKIASSKKKGMWMGGHVPLGYDVKDKCLIINVAEAKTIQLIFDLYLKLGSAHNVASSMNRMGYITKIRTDQSGQRSGGKPFTRGHIYYILSNHTYIGKTAHKDKLYKGLHEPIIDNHIWKTVQNKLSQNINGKRRKLVAKNPSLLTGILFDQLGERLSPTHTVKKGKRYRYYVSKSLLKQTASKSEKAWRISAWELESAVIKTLTGLFTDHHKLLRLTGIENHNSENIQQAICIAKIQIEILENSSQYALFDLISKIVVRVVLSDSSLSIKINTYKLTQLLSPELKAAKENCNKEVVHSIKQPFKIKKRGSETKLVIGEKLERSSQRGPHKSLIKAIVRGTAWYEQIKTGKVSSINDLSCKLGLNRSYVSRVIAFAFTSPNLIEAALKGETDTTVNVNKLIQHHRLPVLWKEQERLFGVNSKKQS